ncbi:MAG: stage III sporulation protein AB [Firmicutes bacterium]|nr:stage III sporulation protein AB [Bacillota bacterium]
MRALLTGPACLLILLSCAGLGACGAARLRQRARLLAGAVTGVEALLRQVEFLAAPLPAALSAAAEQAGAAAGLFAAAGRELREGEGITGDEAWRAALIQSETWGCEEALLAVSAGLGETGGPSQLRQLQVCRERLLREQRQAEEDYARFGRVWRSLGWCGGAVLILLLI